MTEPLRECCRLRCIPTSVESRFWTQAAWLLMLIAFSSNSIGVSMPRLEWRRRRL